MLADQTVRDILASFSAPDPTPGGGSASALGSAVGVSLLMMVAGLAKTRNGSDDERAALAAASTALAAIRDELTTAIDTDTAAYDEVVSAYKLPKATPDEQQTRKAAIERAMQTATEIPLSVMRLSAVALEHAAAVEAYGNPSAASDVGVAIALLNAGRHGARLNVETNLGSLKDQDLVERIRMDVKRYSGETV
jgi:formiminotetrahydrofolate cyclodeaminase